MFPDGNKDYFLKCGAIPGVYPTVDFSVWQDIDVSFGVQRKYAPKGPLVNYWHTYIFSAFAFFWKLNLNKKTYSKSCYYVR